MERNRKNKRHAPKVRHDAEVQNEGTIYLLRPLTPAATEWIEQYLPEDRMHFGGAVVVEWRYIADIVAGMQGDGLVVAL